MKNNQKKYGQFFTNPKIASFMAKLAISERTKTVLDPAVGPGVLLQNIFAQAQNPIAYTACEIDGEMIKQFNLNISFPVTVKQCDYLENYGLGKFDAIICNPPYNKFQDIPKRDEYIRDFSHIFDLKINGNSNLCVYFLIKSLHELNIGGKCVYIVPYEFLNTGYGDIIKKFFLQTKMLKAIYKFNNDLLLFDDAITTSCILYFENSIHDSVDFITINALQELENDSYHTETKKYCELKNDIKWNLYFYNRTTNHYKNLISFKTIAKVKRGIATGNNSFFCLSKSQIINLGISKNSYINCICKAPDVQKLVFTNNTFNELVKQNKKTFLFYGEGAKTANDFKYIEYGEQNGVNLSFLNSHRTPWYLIEEKAIAPIWIAVFNRNRIKIIRNETNSKNLSTFHGVYLTEDYVRFTNILFCYLLTPISQKILCDNKREYGDGLNKFEPNDINNSFILDFKIIDNDDINTIEKIYIKIKKNNLKEEYLRELEKIFNKYLL